MPRWPPRRSGSRRRELLAEGAAEVTPLGASPAPSELDDFHHERALWAPGTRSALVGRRILLPRREGALAEAIRAAGAEVDAVPVTRTEPLPFSLPGHRGLAGTHLARRRRGARRGRRGPADLLGDAIAAVGPATAAAITEAGAQVDLVPAGRSDAEALLAALPTPARRRSALLAGSALVAARPRPTGCARRGWDVDVVHTYTTVPVTDAPAVRPWSDYDAVVLTAGSIAPRRRRPARHAPSPHVAVVALGEPSAAACDARAAGAWTPSPPPRTAPGVIDALTRHLDQENA